MRKAAPTSQASLLRKSILQAAVQGKLVPQDESDEPANVLLARIKAEKAKLVKEGKLKKEKPLPPITEEEKPFALPDGWEWVRLGEITFSIATGPFGSMLHKYDYIQNGIPLVNPINMRNCTIVSSSKMMVSEETKERLKNYELRTNDIVIARRGDLGRCAIVTDKEHGWLCGTGSFILRLTSAMSLHYYTLFFKSPFSLKQLLGNSVGATMNNLNHTILGKLCIPLPPLAEQERIVAKVNELILQCDQLEQAEQAVLALDKHFFETLPKSILQSAVQGKLVPQNENDEPASVLLERIKAEKAKLIKEGKLKKEKPLSPIAEEEKHFDLPQGWEWVRLGEISESNIGLTYSPAEISTTGIAVLRSNNIQDGKIVLNELVYVHKNVPEKLLAQKGDMLICARNGSKRLVGKAAIIEESGMSFGAFMAILRSSLNKYLLVFINSPIFRTQIQGNESDTTTINQITQGMLKSVVVPLPPLAEQKRIVAKAEELMRISNMSK